MGEAIVAAVVGFLIGIGLNPVATRLPYVGREPEEVYPDGNSDDGIYVRLGVRKYLVPIVTALLFGWLWWRAGNDWRLASVLTLYSTIFLLVAVVDLETRLIPNVLILPGIGVALLGSVFDPRLTLSSALLGGAVGFVIFYVIALLARGGFGAGDVKLAAFIGVVTGFPTVLIGLVAGIFAGGIVALLLLVTRLATRKTYMPYGPFLCLGGWYAMLFGDQVFWSQFG